MIELGATFHSDLTGMENLHLYAAALGLTRREIRERIPEMFDFAGVEAFAEVPIKYYSSGMRARLAFAVALSADPQILLLDEVLAVGDSSFRSKCYDRLHAFQASGGTLVVVSHDLDSVRILCERAVWLQDGQVRQSGPVNEVVEAYESCALQLAGADADAGD